jgi:hypothetical protein
MRLVAMRLTYPTRRVDKTSVDPIDLAILAARLRRKEECFR